MVIKDHLLPMTFGYLMIAIWMNCIRRLEYEWNKVFKKYKETEENLDENLDTNSIL